MKRKVFFSFHYKLDAWRAGEVRNIGVVEGNEPVSDNRWEEVKRGGDPAIERWIQDQMRGRSCAIVLVGAATAGRKWINYEIRHAWNEGKGVVGIRIHGLKNQDGRTTTKGDDPFARVSVNGVRLSSIVKCCDPIGAASTDKYDWIKENIALAVEEAIRIRQNHS